MKLAHVVSSVLVKYGGSTRAVLDMARWQSRLGTPCMVLTGAEEGAGELEPAAAATEVTTVRFPVAGPHDFRYQRGLSSYLRKNGGAFDLFVLHSSYQYPAFAASRFCRRNAIPYIFMPHGSLDPEVRKKHPLRNRFVDFAYHDAVIANADSWHFTSEEERTTCERRIWRASFAEPLGVDVDQIPRGTRSGLFRQRYAIPADAKLFLFLSRITRKKGIDILLDAFTRLVAEGDDVYLALCGPIDDDMRPLLDRALADPAIRRRLVPTGLVLGDIKDAAFFDSDCFVLPTYSENFGFAPFEALAYGLPVITTTGMNLHAELAGSDRVTIIEPRGEDLYRAMRRAARGEWQYASDIDDVRAWLDDKFSWRRRAARILERYTEVLRARRG